MENFIKKIARAGALAGSILVHEGAQAQETNLNQKILSEQDNLQVEVQNQKNMESSVTKEDKIIATSLEDLKFKLKSLVEKKNKEYTDDDYLYEAISHYDDYKQLQGAEDFVVECAEKYIGENPGYFFSSLENLSDPLPKKLEDLVLRESKNNPIEALRADQVLSKFRRLYPQIILATLNKGLLEEGVISSLIDCVRVLSKSKATHPASEMLREVLVKKLKISAMKNPSEILEMVMDGLEDWMVKNFPDIKTREEFSYILLSGLIGKDNKDDILQNFQFFASYEMCRPVLSTVAQGMPETVLELVGSELGEVKLSGENSTKMPTGLKDFYFQLISETLGKVGDNYDLETSLRDWVVIKYLYPEQFENLRKKFGDVEKFSLIFGNKENLELDPDIKKLFEKKQ